MSEKKNNKYEGVDVWPCIFLQWTGASAVRITNQSIIVWTLKTKSLLTSLYEREEFPSLEKRG
jgi:hypothetical protein